jgi:hypothetical protein
MPRVHRRLSLPPERPARCLTFAPLAWLKLQFFCHAGPTEVGGFGVASEHDLLYVEDFVTVRQQATPVTVRFEDEAVADFFDRMVDRSLHVEQFSRLWMHTHPASSVTPSNTDEDTFARCFGRCDWAVMFILGRTGLTYARLAFAAGPGAQLDVPAAVDWAAWPDWLEAEPGLLARELASWHEEYAANVCPPPDRSPSLALALVGEDTTERDWWESYAWHPELDDVTYEPLEDNHHDKPAERRRAG